MGKLPRWAELEQIGHDQKNAHFRLKIKKWAVPFLFIYGLLRPRWLLSTSADCDGMKITETEFV
jgi:hypothetical protein